MGVVVYSMIILKLGVREISTRVRALSPDRIWSCWISQLEEVVVYYQYYYYFNTSIFSLCFNTNPYFNTNTIHALNAGIQLIGQGRTNANGSWPEYLFLVGIRSLSFAQFTSFMNPGFRPIVRFESVRCVLGFPDPKYLIRGMSASRLMVASSPKHLSSLNRQSPNLRTLSFPGENRGKTTESKFQDSVYFSDVPLW